MWRTKEILPVVLGCVGVNLNKTPVSGGEQATRKPATNCYESTGEQLWVAGRHACTLSTSLAWLVRLYTLDIYTPYTLHLTHTHN